MVPKAVAVPLGEISVIWPPTSTPSRCASRSPTATSSSLNSCERAGDDMVGDQLAVRDVLGRGCRAPARPTRRRVGLVAMHLALDQRRRRDDARHRATLRGERVVIGRARPAGA